MLDIISFRKCLSIVLSFFLMGVILIPSTISVEIKNSPISAFCDGNTLYVGGTGPNNYTKIQDAIDNSNNGDTVFVYDDSSPYYENLSIYRSINLIGEDKHTTIINGNDIEDLIRITVDNVTLENFYITNGFFGITLSYVKNCVISNNIFKGITYKAIWIWVSQHNLIIDNYFESNNSAFRHGVSVQGGDYNNITGNTIEDFE